MSTFDPILRAIMTGDIPACLRGRDWRQYVSLRSASATWADFARAWRDVAYVRMQGFERDWDAATL